MKLLIEKLNYAARVADNPWRTFILGNELERDQPGNAPLHNMLNILNKLDLTRWHGD